MIRTSWPRSLAALASGALVALLVPSPAAAQDTGVVSGTVIDSTGQVVPGATVTLTNETKGDLRTMVSNERGEFSFRAVTPGSYTVKVELAGFRSIEQRNNINRNSLIINYTWDVPGHHTGLARALLDGWQASGENDFVSGDWANVTFTTTDSFDFTGGEAGTGACLAGSEPCLHLVRPVLVGDPMAGAGDPLTGFFNTAAFARPTRGSYGNTPRNVVQKPGLINTNFAVFKNIGFGNNRAAQFRAEIYNLFNQVEFQDIDRTARFDTSGNEINPNFGTAIGIANPTRPPRTVQLSVRLNF